MQEPIVDINQDYALEWENQSLWYRIRYSKLWIRTFSWEYWPAILIYTPIFFYYLFLAIRARSLFFFTAANPIMENGGLYGTSKYNLHQHIPSHLAPKTILVYPKLSEHDLLKYMHNEGMDFPVIAKPDMGERGRLVKLIKNIADLEAYRERVHVEFILQDFIDYPNEMGVFYYRMPNSDKGVISSIVKKIYLKVTGNGYSTIGSLIQRDPRGRLQYDKLLNEHPELMAIVLEEGEEREVSPIGNHSKGAKFLDGRYLITDELQAVFDSIAKQIEGFHYGRIDLKYDSIDDLYKGKNFTIIEVNGAASEPAHIYEPGYPIGKGFATIFKHWYKLYRISKLNHKTGVPYLNPIVGFKSFFNYLSYTSSLK